VNGGDAQEGVHNGAALIPNLDSIAEFRILTNNFDAQYGNYSGGQINVVTKAGTNQFHGDVFDFLRNTDLDAANYEDQGTRGVYIQNQFGGTVGGPIKRGKVFFFGDYQGTRLTIGNSTAFNVPSLADRTGDLSDQAGNMTGSVVGAYWANILAQKLGYAVADGEPYYYLAGEPLPSGSGNYTADCMSSSYAAVNSNDPGCVFSGAQIPITGANSVLDPVARAILAIQPNGNTPAYIPAPNGTLSGNPNSYIKNAFPETLNDNKYGLRGDINTGFGKFFVYYFSDKFNSINPYQGSSVP